MATKRQVGLWRKYGQIVPALYGYNRSGFPIGDDTGYGQKLADEDLETEHDPLVRAKETGTLLLHPMYFEEGYTTDPHMYMRRPALTHLECFSSQLFKRLGWVTRGKDMYRPPRVYQRGLVWAVRKKLARYNVSERHFRAALEAVCKGQESIIPISTVESLCKEAKSLFAGVAVKSCHMQLPAGVQPIIVEVAANLEVIPAELDPHAISGHGSGGVADLDFLRAGTLLPVNMGTQVDFPDLPIAFGYFEDVLPTMQMQTGVFAREGLLSLTARKMYYRRLVGENDVLRQHLSLCGVNVEQLQSDEKYFEDVWMEIRTNRRALFAVAAECGVLPYGDEWWHFDFDDAHGGVRFQRTGVRSGGPSYAVYCGQEKCAWGNAYRLYQALNP